jgi:hypothetical protein
MSENISSTVLFHFTRSMENLKSILKHGVYPRYCPEYSLAPADRTAASKRKPPLRAAPLVCFCDLPLSLIRKHLEAYGPFGIGLTKQWGVKNRLTPVIYTHSQAPTLHPILRLTANAQDADERTGINDAMLLTSYSKPFVGSAWRNSRVKRKVRFYDEREWRFVPVVREVKSLLLTWPDYINSSKKDALHRLFRCKYRLAIHPDDIMYLIVPYRRDERNILHLARFVRRLYKRERDKLLVTSTIMTDDCIQEDV